MKQFRLCTLLLALALSLGAFAIDNVGITFPEKATDRFTLIEEGQPTPLLADQNADPGVMRALHNLQDDFEKVCGTKASIAGSATQIAHGRAIIVGMLQSPLVQQLVKKRLLDEKSLKGKREKYIMTTISNPLPGIDEALVIVGSDKRGTIYGIYELSEQLGVSPWYYWADVPVEKHTSLYITRGAYTAGEPAVRYRGIFLNDEAPCLTSWVKNTFGTNYGGHAFYEKVFELLLRLRANFLWPAMWGWAFYADDPANSPLANEMGIIMGTSHHEPMARNHQEWVRHRREYGIWDYALNKDVLDKFFTEGIRRSRNNEDLITIGMRGDGDTALGVKEGHEEERPDDQRNIKMLEDVIAAQRRIIARETGRPANQRPQVWALYKEVQHYYDLGLRVPDDVTILLSDDNWGDVRHLPTAEERRRSGGWGMYYHVDYVGAPRNSKWLNVTPIQNLWEQMSLSYEYGVDRLWVLNVGDLKPMEYPITLFLDMAWNPSRFTAANLMAHPQQFCESIFGAKYADEAARILNLYSKYNGRTTAEMLDPRTYNLASGEWLHVVNEYKALEADALRLYAMLPEEMHDAYQQLILFPVQAMCNIYEMRYAQAMNSYCFEKRDRSTNLWAERVAKAFRRDSMLCAAYNHNLSGGKWNGMMTQKHISYVGWHDDFPRDVMPKVYTLKDEDVLQGGCIFQPDNANNKEGYLAIEAEHYYNATAPTGAQWTIIPNMGRTLSAISLQPYSIRPDGATLTYAFRLPQGVEDVDVHIITKSTLAFERTEGHRYTVGFRGCNKSEVNYNGDMNEEPQNIHRSYYPVVSRRVVEKKVHLTVARAEDGLCYLEFTPIEPAVVLEKIVIDYKGYKPQFLFGKESAYSKKAAQ